ncbi:MAG: caspase family protein [Prevotellaceae bacterium]|jgi:hypothetical protein|nr:caspase family protein [Prevotellaceae bacterium]
MTDFVQNIIAEIIDQYMFADNTRRPWIIGFSGGKDSTVMLQLVWKALEQVKHFHGFVGRDIYVVCNDTMVENPVITEYVYRVLDKIEIAARDQGVPVRVIKTLPRLEDSLWVNMIRRGYPAPNNALVVGINNYPSAPLSGCINDASALGSIIKTNGDGSPNFDVRLETNITTKSDIKRKIVDLFAGNADTALFYFSGHGFLNDIGGYVVTPDFRQYDEGLTSRFCF